MKVRVVCYECVRVRACVRVRGVCVCVIRLIVLFVLGLAIDVLRQTVADHALLPL
jgi:hypothetical protein